MSSLNISNFIWGIADDVLRDVYVRGKYRDVILPMTVIRRLDAVLEPTKDAVLSMKNNLDAAGVANQDAALRQASGEAFYNTSPFRLRDLTYRAQQQRLRVDFEAYLDGFSSNVQEVLDKFKLRNQIPTLIEADALGYLIDKFLDNSVNLSPRPVMNGDGSVRLEGLDNHSMGTVFEELIRRFNEENNEEAGEHFTPRDVVQLMAHLIFEPVVDQIKSSTYLVYDGACGTGGNAHGRGRDAGATRQPRKARDVSVHLFGQEVNPETYAISKADLILKGEGDEANNIGFGSTLSNGRLPRQRFRLHAVQSAIWQVVEDRPRTHGRKEGPQGPPLPDRTRRRPRIQPRYALQRRADALPCQHAQQDEAGHGARQPDRRGAQR